MSKLNFSDFIQFIKTSSFWKNAAIAFFVSVFLVVGVIQLMAFSTRQGEKIKLPNLLNVELKQVPKMLQGININYLVIDSVYNPKEKPGIVIRQIPEAGEFVKANRFVYLYITTVTPPKLQMPKLIDRSLRQASFMIESYGLKLGKVRYVSNPCKHCVLRQFFKGREILPNDTIRKGSVIDLEVGKGESNGSVSVPVLTGMRFCQAREKLRSMSLSIGSVVCSGVIVDTCDAIIQRQVPEAGNDVYLTPGAVIDLFISTQQEAEKDE